MAWLSIFSNEAPKRTFKKNDLEAIFTAHEADELRGFGSLTAREELINDIIKAHTVVLAQATGIIPRRPAPAYKDNTVALVSNTAAAAAKAAKAAE